MVAGPMTEGRRMIPGSRRPGRRTRRLRCFACGASPPEARVVHFNLMVTLYPNGRTDRATNRGAGTIDLCETCWAKARAASQIRRSPRPRATAS